MKTLLYCLFPGLFTLPGLASADEATIFGVYEDCVAISSTVLVKSSQLSVSQADDIAAQAEAAGYGLEFDQALPVMISSLEKSGIRNIEIQRQGNCNVRSHGKYVEAVVDYCNEKVVKAEIHIDGTVFFQQHGAAIALGDFVNAARHKLEAAGIYGDPRFSLNNITDCENQQSSG